MDKLEEDSNGLQFRVVFENKKRMRKVVTLRVIKVHFCCV